MTAKEYLKGKVIDEWAEPTSVETRMGLAAYAIRIHEGVEGYNLSDVESLLASCGCGEEFIESCVSFISNSTNFMDMVELIQVELDD